MFTPILISAVLASTGPISGAIAKTGPKRQQPKTRNDQALARLQQEYKKYGQHVSGLKHECVSFEVEDSTAKAVTIVEKELHNKTCGGDASTSPKVATFVIRGNKVFIEDPVSGDTIPFNQTFKSDGP